MRFYDIDAALQEAIVAEDKPVRLKIEIQAGDYFEVITEEDIIEANFFGLKETAGGVSSRGEITFNSEQVSVSNETTSPRSEVRVYFSIGEGLPYFRRFVFYIDDKGVQLIKGPGRKRYIRLRLQDLSYKLRRSDEARDWTSPALYVYSVVCDKSRPEISLVHGIAQRAGLTTANIDCSTIPVTLPFIQLKRNIWAELSSLATAYRCHLETAPEMPLVFAHSPYQSEQLTDNDCSYTFTGRDIFHLHKISRAELYKNSIRLKINMPVSLEKQEIWRYDDSPVFYDDFLQANYPFRYPITRKIEAWDYEAKYRIIEPNGKNLNVIYADQVDTKEEAENRLDYVGGPFSYFQYDTSSPEKAILKLHKSNDGDLYHASIHGRPIVLDLNRSFFCRDEGEINRFGTVALNVTGSYFSDELIEGRRQYEDWALRELAERKQQRQEITVKTHRALFNARVGANVKIEMRSEEVGGRINAFSFRYRKDRAFVSAFRILEEGGYDNE